MAGISIVIDSSAAIQQFDVIALRIYNRDSLVYDYATDKTKPETAKLMARLQRFIKTVKVKKLNNEMTAPTETYQIAVKFR
ncbi:hypothetical protein [Chitinophaga varians]|uniref:hypothetical protein n=1 Tax=Chitinophaga varians TaxID=2202339 RepID=UPI00165F5643|nr:hypothetical protein [Chitinophaga varians]MBC9915545.1 hypothetical protein [Chitinophaga varians]